MQGSQYSEPDFEVQVITLEHAISAGLRGALQLIAGALCLAFGWDFVIWAAQDFPDAATVLLGPNASSMVVNALAAWLGLALVIGGKTKLFFVTLVYWIDQWIGRPSADMDRRGSVDPFE